MSKKKAKKSESPWESEQARVWGHMSAKVEQKLMSMMDPKMRFKLAFDTAILQLMNYAAAVLHLKKPSEADKFRASMIETMMEDMTKMRDSLMDTFDIPWEEYKKRWEETQERILKEMEITKQ